MKVDHYIGGRLFIHGPKHRKQDQWLSLKHFNWIPELSMYSKPDIKEVRGD